MATIGLPKGMFYYQHSALWERFFRNLGCNVVVSEDTNKRILDCGVKCCSNETCLPVKVFHGHVYSLKDRVDYIFIPRYTSLEKNEYTCPKFCGLPDMARLNLGKGIRILEVSMHVDKGPGETARSLEEVGTELGVEPERVENAFRDAQRAFREGSREERPPLPGGGSFAVCILGHPYMIYDRYLSMQLIKKLTDRGITVYTPESLDRATKRKNAYPYQGEVFWEVGLDNLGSAFTFAEDKNVRGIIYLTPFACGIDSFVTEFIERRFKSHYSVPFMKLTVDEHTGEAGFDTRLEAFLDMI